MQLKEKINIRRYIILTLIPLIGLTFFLSKKSEWIGVIILIIGIITNHLLHIWGIASFLNQKDTHHKGLSLLFILGKTVILAISVIISVQFLQKKLFITVIIYLYMLMVLSLSLKRDTQRN